MKQAPPMPPEGLRTAGSDLWAAISGEFDLSEVERLQLLQAARVADALEELQAVVVRDGVTVVDRFGSITPHPALVEARQQRALLARLVAALRIPDSDDVKPQRRTARGTHR